MKKSILAGIFCGCAVMAAEDTCRKSVCAAIAEKPPVIDGVLSEAEWQNAGSFSDFGCYRTNEVPAAATEVKIMRNGGNFYLGIRCMEPGKINDSNTVDGIKVWQGDLIEIFFALRQPELWSMQLAVGAGGGRFSNAGYDDWEAAVQLNEDCWTAEVRIPAKMIRMDNGGVGFNICRQRVNAGEFVCWSPVQNSYHEVEAFGELLLMSYKDTLAMRYGVETEEEISRSEYEKAVQELIPAPADILHGPWLSYPTEKSITVSWETYGNTSGILEYRKSGAENWQSVPANLKYGVITSCRFHNAVLAELEAGQKYEYRIKSILAGGGTCYADGWTFTTLDRDKKEFSFALFTDIHDQEWVLRQMWENSFPRKADFCVNLGDMSSAMNGSAIFYDGFLDTQVDLFASGTPIVWGRGNHELRGEGSALYYDYFNNPAGSSYYAFRHGDVLFIVLDGFSDIGVNDPFGCFDHDNFLADERSWLRELAGSDLFKNASYRVILAHFPPWDMASVAGCSMEYLIKDILDSTEEGERIHLMISGHTHVYSRIMPDGEIITAGETFKSQGGPMKLPFPVVINDGPGGERDGTIIWVNRSPDGLSVETLAPDGTVIDTFALR